MDSSERWRHPESCGEISGLSQELFRARRIFARPAPEQQFLIGDRLTVAMATLQRAALAARRGHWQAALETSIDAAEQQVQLGDHVNLSGSFVVASAAFRELGRLEPAAVAFGAAGGRERPRFSLAWAIDFDAANATALLDALGERQFATLEARGAGLDMTDAVAYLRGEADRVAGRNERRSTEPSVTEPVTRRG